MTFNLRELDADSIYEQMVEKLGELNQFEDDEYREDKMEQMISRHSY